MQLSNVNVLMSDPLAGCLEVFKNRANATNFISSLQLRLALCISSSHAETIVEHLHQDTENMINDGFEYIINELLYELRRLAPKHMQQFNESEVLNKWGTVLLKSHSENEVLDFVTSLLYSRGTRELY